jgi:hypothetical protein
LDQKNGQVKPLRRLIFLINIRALPPDLSLLKFMDPVLKECLDKHLPKISEISYHCGLLILLSLVLGFSYSFIFLKIPPQIRSTEFSWRFNTGFGLGLVATVSLLAIYIVWLITRGAVVIVRCYKRKATASKKNS